MTETWHERQATGSCDRHILSETGPVCIIPFDWGTPEQRAAHAKLILAAPSLQATNAGLLAALEEAHKLAVAHGWAPAHREGWKEAITKAKE